MGPRCLTFDSATLDAVSIPVQDSGCCCWEHHGILTLNAARAPGSRVSLRLKASRAEMERVGQTGAVVAAVASSLRHSAVRREGRSTRRSPRSWGAERLIYTLPSGSHRVRCATGAGEPTTLQARERGMPQRSTRGEMPAQWSVRSNRWNCGWARRGFQIGSSRSIGIDTALGMESKCSSWSTAAFSLPVIA